MLIVNSRPNVIRRLSKKTSSGNWILKKIGITSKVRMQMMVTKKPFLIRFCTRQISKDEKRKQLKNAQCLYFFCIDFEKEQMSFTIHC